MRTDEQLAEAAGGGDLGAFEELVRRHEARVYSTALRMTGDAEDARDLAQEAFLRVYRSLASFRGGSKFSTWLYRIVSNLCIDHIRRRPRVRTLSLARESDDGERYELDPPDERADVERAAETREMREALERALLTLSDEHRQIFLLRELDGLSYAEITEALQLEEGTVKSRLARARAALRTALSADGNFFQAHASYRAKGGA